MAEQYGRPESAMSNWQGAEDAEIEAADDREARRTGGTFAKHYLGGFDLPGGESTSARLRQVQADLAASQADLTRVERERDEALAAQARIGDRMTEDIVRLTAYRRERDLVRAELATASKEVRLLRAARQWVVARDGGRYCESCEQEIRRGEAYAEQPGTGGLLEHIHCPDSPIEGAPMENDNQPDGGDAA